MKVLELAVEMYGDFSFWLIQNELHKTSIIHFDITVIFLSWTWTANYKKVDERPGFCSVFY